MYVCKTQISCVGLCGYTAWPTCKWPCSISLKRDAVLLRFLSKDEKCSCRVEVLKIGTKDWY